jgi:hypothetical protein
MQAVQQTENLIRKQLMLSNTNIEKLEKIAKEKKLLARHPRYISSWDIHVQRLIPLGRLN